jgi:hypothetical protein
MMIASRQEKFGIVDVNRLPLVGAGGLLDALTTGAGGLTPGIRTTPGCIGVRLYQRNVHC